MGNGSSDWDPQRFQDYLVRHATNRGITGRTELAEAAKIKPGMLSKYYSGAERPSPETLWKLHQATGAPFNELLILVGRVPSDRGDQGEPEPPEVTLDPLALEVSTMLSASSPLDAGLQTYIRDSIDRLIEPYRRQMRGRRKVS